MYDKKLTLDECLDLCNKLLQVRENRGLKDTERYVIEGSWDKQTYQQIADHHRYELSYIRGDVGCKLWKCLGEALNVQVSKSNFRTQLQLHQAVVNPAKQSDEAIALPPEQVYFRGIPVYVKRPPLEEQYCQAIQEPGALLRIRAPQKMGKTLLLDRVIEHGISLGYPVVRVDFRLLEKPILSSLKDFFQWFCFYVAEDLEIDPQIDQFWQDQRGHNKNFMNYFEMYLLPKLDTPLILALDNVDALFATPGVCQEFLKVLRAIHEGAKRTGRGRKMWQKLRLIVSYSTQDYPQCDINHSPFNVGFVRGLPALTLAQMRDCAQGYELQAGLGSDESGLAPLHVLLAGHPYLTQEAIAFMAVRQIGVTEFMALAATSKSPFRTYLSALLQALKRSESLRSVFKQVVVAEAPIAIPEPLNFHLESMGLITEAGVNLWRVSNPLYQQFFLAHLDEL